MSDLELKPAHKFFRVTISSIKHTKYTNSDTISLHAYNNSPYKITLPLGILGIFELNATISPTIEIAYKVKNILKLLDICQSTILKEELSINKIINDQKRKTDYFTKPLFSKPTFQISKNTTAKQKFLTMFNFQHSQYTQQEFEQLVELLLKNPMVYATSKFDVGKLISPLQPPLNFVVIFKKQRASKVPIHLQDKVNKLIDILEQYKIIFQ